LEMEVNYNKLWKQMIDKGMKKSDLRELTGIGTNTLAKLSKNQPVSMEVLMKLCEKLECDISDVCEFVKK
jgi:putative transcriptional regulator